MSIIRLAFAMKDIGNVTFINLVLGAAEFTGVARGIRGVSGCPAGDTKPTRGGAVSNEADIRGRGS